MQLLRRPGVAGSLVLALIVVLVLLRPPPGGDGPDDPGPEPGSAGAFVVRAIDGDTIEVALGDGREDVRYIGVDTPETVKPGEPVQCYGPRASDFNHRLVDRRRVRLVFDRERRDVYGRLLAYVYVGGRMASAELVRRGLGRTLTIAPNDRFAPLLARLERRAAVAGRGLWGACPP